MAILDICISTLNDRIGQTAAILDQALRNVRYIVIHQVTDGQSYEWFYQKYSSVKFIPLPSKGLSKSRNAAIQEARSEWIYLCDDDLLLNENIIDILTHAADRFPNADAYCFQINKTDGSLYKPYAKGEKLLAVADIGAVSSAEIVLHRRAIQKKTVHFHPRFGLGAEFISGEEYLMLRNCLQSGGQIGYIPQAIATHPDVGTGHRFTPELAKSKGALIAACYGYLYVFLDLMYAVRKYKNYQKQMTFLSFLQYIYSGSHAYFKHA